MMRSGVIEAIRENHALEHATVALLLARTGMSLRLVGRATANGFYLYGNLPTEMVSEAAHEALLRLKSGESHLAVSPLCGTNLAVAGILAGLASLLALGTNDYNGLFGRWRRLPDVLTAAVIAVVAAQPLGRLMQRHITTSAQVQNLQIVDIVAGSYGVIRYHKITTRRTES